MFRLMRRLWPQMKQIAPTLRYDARVMGGDFEVPTAELKKIRIPALAIWGSKAKPEMSKANAAIAEAIPGAGHRILEGQTHNVTPAALRPEIVEFFA
jgi:pimeloyl-ACP methyl ester carboxylesterase